MRIYKLTPVIKDYIWGGNKLKTQWNKNFDGERIAESWELSTHSDGKSAIELNGGNNSITLKDLLGEKPQYISQTQTFERFPLMIKLIDAAGNLSVQVHPDDCYAKTHENDLGKTEMWYIADADDGAGIYLGFNRDTCRQEVEMLIKDGKIEGILNFIPVKKGQGYLINAGTIHAICAGVTICEVQQSSNVTYRVYDYQRLDNEGNPRKLHVDKALDVLDYSKLEPTGTIVENGLVASSKYFNVYKYNVSDKKTFNSSKESFCAVCITHGSGSIDGIEYKKGDTFFVPAGYGSFCIEGSSQIILTTL